MGSRASAVTPTVVTTGPHRSPATWWTSSRDSGRRLVSLERLGPAEEVDDLADGERQDGQGASDGSRA